MLFFYVRHGEPIYDPDSLTSFGKRQAEALAKRLSRYGIDEIYASTSQRAKDTAKPTCEILKKDMIELDWCNEKYVWNDYSVAEDDGSRSWAFFSQKFRKLACSKSVKNLGNEWYLAPEFKGESFENGIKRINSEADAFFENLGYEHNRENGFYIEKRKNNKRVALFAHQAFGLAFLSSVLDIPYTELATHFDLWYSALTVIEFKEAEGVVIPKVLTLSNDSHIYCEGLPTFYYEHLI